MAKIKQSSDTKESSDSWHEVMDRVFIIQENLDNFVGNHEVCKNNPQIQKLIEKCQDKLVKLYEFSSKKTFDLAEEEQNDTTRITRRETKRI